MAVRDAAWIRSDAISEFVHNFNVVDEADYEYLRDIWPDFYPGEYIIWPELLPLSAGEIGPLGLGWRKAIDGTWYKPASSEAFASEDKA